MTSLVLVLVLIPAAPAHADEVASHVRAVRSDLSLNGAADAVAGGSASAIASAGALFHADLSGLLGPCESVGEIVGAGPDVATVFVAFRNSPSHWRILTNPDWTGMGTGLATSASGEVYVSVVFCAEAAVASAPAPPPPPPAPEPAGAQKVSTPAAKPSVGPSTPKPAGTIQGTLPAVGARRAEIRARLDEHAEAAMPDWYVGLCSTNDRERVLEGTEADSGVCPLAH